ncbi:MAG TPA: ChbG/HpnK family deacetylase [Gemmatimonadales bacterium]|nr:ChbG/HpnK family deacetylase [Gemmatimonadales bacterium]
MTAALKLLIVTADDFGISHGINRGVIEAHGRGILTSTSLLVNRPAAEQAAALGRAYPALSIGLHLELDPDGPPASVPTELERQLARFVQLVGTTPTHVDSHHDVHRDPRVLPEVRAWARRVGVPVRGYSRVRHFSKFYGQWGGESHPEQIGVPGLVRLLDAAFADGEGGKGGSVTELTCHPGYVEPGFTSSYAAEREIELRTLCEPEVRHALEERGIRLIGFRDLPSTAREDAA